MQYMYCSDHQSILVMQNCIGQSINTCTVWTKQSMHVMQNWFDQCDLILDWPNYLQLMGTCKSKCLTIHFQKTCSWSLHSCMCRSRTLSFSRRVMILLISWGCLSRCTSREDRWGMSGVREAPWVHSLTWNTVIYRLCYLQIFYLQNIKYR